ncbi:MAG: hypothetical protein V4674_02270 [Patescibacteria group bacterium]
MFQKYSEEKQGLIEYGVILGLIAVVIVAALHGPSRLEEKLAEEARASRRAASQKIMLRIGGVPGAPSHTQ